MNFVNIIEKEKAQELISHGFQYVLSCSDTSNDTYSFLETDELTNYLLSKYDEKHDYYKSSLMLF